MKDFNTYQRFTCSTRIYPSSQGIVYNLFGIAGEAGEIFEKVKKLIRDKKKKITKKGLSKKDKLEIIKELGDLIWYISTLSDELGYTLEEVISINVKKLTSRKRRNKLKGCGDNR